MLDILLCIVFSASLIVIFKIAGQRQVRTFPMIVVNYWVAALCGLLLCPQIPQVDYVLQVSWLPLALLLGVMFITIFNLIGLSTLRSGIAVTAIAQKMSLVIPIMVAVVFFGESLTALKALGILLALGSIVMTTYKPKQLAMQTDVLDHSKPDAASIKTVAKLAMLLPFMVFVGSGLCDTVVNIIHKSHLKEQDTDLLNTILFTTSAIAGSLVLIFQLLRRKEQFTIREALFGVIMGVPNYFSLYFLIKALQRTGMESSAVFPIVNIGVVTTAAVVAYFGFKEHLTLVNIGGIILAIIAIMVLTLV